MYLVIDIGGSSVKSAIWQAGQLSEQQQWPSPGNWQTLLARLEERVSELTQTYKINAVSFSLPGVVNQETGRLEGASSLAYLHEVAFREQVAEKLQLPVLMENDANCASLAELTYGAAKGKKEVVFVVIGTGIGGTIVSGGEIKAGHHLFAGEFGMMLVNGKEEWAVLGSAVHMARKVSLAKGLAPDSLSGEVVFELAKNGDVLAMQGVEELYHYLALGIYNLQYMLDPELIILGGGISARTDLIPQIERHLNKIMAYGQRSPLFPKLKCCNFANEANLIGAAVSGMRQSKAISQ